MTREPNQQLPAEGVQPDETGGEHARAEIAHVLFMDLIGYSKVPTDNQGALIDKLQTIVQNTREFRRAHSKNEIIPLPTGDGMALVFLEDPVAPVRCALEIAAEVRKQPEIRLRMGVNSGPVYRRTDITGNVNVSGAGIDYAQRAMDRGEAGHILLTKPAGDFLSYLGMWAKDIHDIGEYPIKHDKKIQLYNFYRGELGNPQTPPQPALSGGPAGEGMKWARDWKRPRQVALVGLAAVAVAMGAWLWPVPSPPPLNAPSTILTDRFGQELYPSLSPDGAFLIYASKTGEHWRICRQRLVNEFVLPTVENLTEGNQDDNLQPALSPDGKTVAFRSERGGGGIFRMNLADRSVRALTDRGYNPSWSPDGKRVVYAMESILRVEDRATSKSKLWTVKVDTGETSMLYEGDAVQPSWSPHGQRIAFWYVHDGGTRDIATIASEGGRSEPVTEDRTVSWEFHTLWHTLRHGSRASQDRYMNWDPVWSPDGRYIYYATDRGGSMGLWRIRIAEETGKVLSAPQLVTRSSEDEAHISLAQDGKHFVFVRRSFSADLHLADFDPVNEKAGTPKAILEGALATRPDISPSGDEVTFNSGDGNRDRLFVFKTGKNEARLLLGDAHKDRGPRWAPDGKRIAFFSNRSRNWEIWTVGPDGKELQQITDVHDSSMIYPVWSPKGDRLAYTLQGKTPEETQTGIIELGKSRADTGRHVLKGLGDTNESFTAWSWSPDETALAGYGQRFDGRPTGISILNLSSQEHQRLTTFGSDPAWLSDGRRLLFHRDGRIWLVDKTHPQRVKEILSVAPDEVARRGFGVSRDDRFIYFSRQRIRSQIRLGTLL